MQVILKYICPHTNCKFLHRSTCMERIKRAAGEKKTVTAYSDAYWFCAGCKGPLRAGEPNAVIVKKPDVTPVGPRNVASKAKVEKAKQKSPAPAPVTAKKSAPKQEKQKGPTKPKPKPRPSRAKKPDTLGLPMLRIGANRVFPAKDWQKIRNAVMYLHHNTAMMFEYRKLADGVRVTRHRNEPTALPVQLRRHIITCCTCGRKFRGINAISCPECRERTRNSRGKLQ